MHEQVLADGTGATGSGTSVGTGSHAGLPPAALGRGARASGGASGLEQLPLLQQQEGSATSMRRRYFNLGPATSSSPPGTGLLLSGAGAAAAAAGPAMSMLDHEGFDPAGEAYAAADDASAFPELRSVLKALVHGPGEGCFLHPDHAWRNDAYGWARAP